MGGLDPSWLIFAFLGHPDFQSRGPNNILIILKGFGTPKTGNWGGMEDQDSYSDFQVGQRKGARWSMRTNWVNFTPRQRSNEYPIVPAHSIKRLRLDGSVVQI